MIKRYKDFDSTEYLSNERDSMERELRARKTRRNNMKHDLNITLDLIKRQIVNSIEQGYEYVLSIGKRKEELENSTETVFHIEFEDESMGRIRIFKPKDTADKGHYEVNGDYYETSAKEVRDFYHLLNQEIKGQPMVVRESLTDKMVGKSEKEVKKAQDDLMDELIDIGIEDGWVTDETKQDIVVFFESIWDSVKELVVSEGWTAEEIFDNYRTDLDEYFAELEDKVEESLTDKMTPKNEEEMEVAWEKLADKMALNLLDYGEFDDYTEAYEFVEKHKERLIKIYDEGWKSEDLMDFLMMGWEKE